MDDNKVLMKRDVRAMAKAEATTAIETLRQVAQGGFSDETAAHRVEAAKVLLSIGFGETILS